MEKLITKFASENNLSVREKDVFANIAGGIVTSEAIAKALDISPNTVRIHIKNINTKVGTHSKAEFLARFLKFAVGT